MDSNGGFRSLLKNGKNIELSFIGKGSSKIKKQIIDQFIKNNFSKNLKFIDFFGSKWFM